jgi:glucuronate isomerase
MTLPFIHDDFLLENKAAAELYHGYAAKQPVIDYHNHLSPAQIAADYQFGDLAEMWLAGDHYKWRALRANGVPERLITGAAPPLEKFRAWARTVPYTLRNPLYHWTHLELARDFGISGKLLNAETADEIWTEANALLPSLSVHAILKRHEVRVLCTTDDPADSLDTHRKIQASGLKTRVYPTYRPDKALQLHDPAAFAKYLERLEQAAGMPVKTFDDLRAALQRRHDDFHALGCRASDHGLGACPSFAASASMAAAAFVAARAGRVPTPEEQGAYAAFLLQEVGRWNAARGWAQQLHLGPMRNNSRRQFAALGPDAGFDSIGDLPQAQALAAHLDALDRTGELPRTILYNMNPADNYVFATMAGNFQDGTIPGKVQFGSGWWFLDQKEGMEWQMNALSSIGLLRRFVGMVTDSRSFLSFPRHEYFRRVLCNLLGADMERGDLPNDRAMVGSMVSEICFTNARDYFGFEA